MVNPLRDGRFEADLPLVGGLFFKGAGRPLVEDLAARGLLFREVPYKHSYPHCWRCHTVPGSLAMDPADVQARVTSRTKAAISLPLWGYPADHTAAATVLVAAGVPLIEGTCQAHGTRVRGR